MSSCPGASAAVWADHWHAWTRRTLHNARWSRLEGGSRQSSASSLCGFPADRDIEGVTLSLIIIFKRPSMQLHISLTSLPVPSRS